MNFYRTRVALALWLCCCLVTQCAAQRRYGERATPGSRPLVRSRLSFSELFASRFSTPRIQRNLTGFGPFKPRVTPGTCPFGCRCYSESEVHCSFKRLERVPANLPPNSVKINLAFNKITAISPGAFAASNATLKVLVLQSNEIAGLRGGELSILHRVGILRLSSNRLTGVYRRTFENMTDLSRLHLDQNAIGFVHPQAFRGLAKLTFLQLEGNRLSRLHSDTFATVQFMSYFTFSHIQYLYLSNNRFTLLPQALLAGLTSLRKIYLSGNPWDCSCQIQWLHQWMRESGKYRCKKSLFGARNSTSCALCASPSNLRGREVVRVPFDNVTCSSPRPKTPHDGAITDQFQDETSWLELQTEAVLFRQGTRAKESMTLRLDSRIGSLLLMHCEAARKPETSTGLQRGGTAESDGSPSYVGTFEAMMTCMVDYPAKTRRLDDLLKPYLNAALNFTARSQGGRQTAGRRRDYDVKILGEPFESLAPLGSGLRIATGSVLESSPVLESGQFIVTIASNRFYPEDHKLALLFQSKQVFRPTSEQKWKGDPWTTVMRPRPDARETVVGVVRHSTVLTCRAMGVPRPKLSWILPDQTVLAASRRYKRFRVSRGGRLIIRKLSKRDAGVYYCMSTSTCEDKVAEDAASVRLHVFSSSEVGARREVRSARAREGEDFRIDCAVEASPAATIVWSTPTRSLLNSNSSEGARILSNGSLSLERVETSQSGFYSCVAANRMGAVMMTTFLEVTENNEIVESEIGDDMFEWDEYDNMDIEYVVNPVLDEDTTTWLPPSTTWLPPSTTWLPSSTKKSTPSTTMIQFSTTETPLSTTNKPFSTTKSPPLTTKIPLSTTEIPPLTTQIPFTTTESPPLTTKIALSTKELPPSTTQLPQSNTQRFSSERVKATGAVMTAEPSVPSGSSFDATEIAAVAAASTTLTTSAAPETTSHQKERAPFNRAITDAGASSPTEQRSNGFDQMTSQDVPRVSFTSITTASSAKTTARLTTKTSSLPLRTVSSPKITETTTVTSTKRASTTPSPKPRAPTRFITTNSDENGELSNPLPAGLKVKELPQNKDKAFDVENAVDEIETILKPTIRNLTGELVDIGTGKISTQATTKISSPQATTITLLSPTKAESTTKFSSSISSVKPRSVTTNSNEISDLSGILTEDLKVEEPTPNKDKAFDVETAVEELEVILEPRLRILNGDLVDIGKENMSTLAKTETSVPSATKLSEPTTTNKATTGATTTRSPKVTSDFLVTSKPRSTSTLLTTSSNKVVDPFNSLPASLEINELSPNNNKAFDEENAVDEVEVVLEPRIHDVTRDLVDIGTEKTSTHSTTKTSLPPIIAMTEATNVVLTTLTSTIASFKARTTTPLLTTNSKGISSLSSISPAGLKIKDSSPNTDKVFDVVEEVKVIAKSRPRNVTNGLLDVGTGKSLDHVNKQLHETIHDSLSTLALATSSEQTEMAPVPAASQSPRLSQTSVKPDWHDTLFGDKILEDEVTSGQGGAQTGQPFRFTPMPGIPLSPLTFASQASIGTVSTSQLSDSTPLPVSPPAVTRDGQEPTRALRTRPNSVALGSRTTFASTTLKTRDDVITPDTHFEVTRPAEATVTETVRTIASNANRLTTLSDDELTTTTQSEPHVVGYPDFDESEIVVLPSLTSLTKPSRNATKIIREAPRTVSTQLHQSEMQEFSNSVEGVENNFATLLCARRASPSSSRGTTNDGDRGPSKVLKSTWTLPSGERVSFPNQLSGRYDVGLSSLNILDLTLNDSGTYFCDSSSEFGLSRAVITLAVRAKVVSTEAAVSAALPIEDPPKFDVDSQFSDESEPAEGRTLAANSPAAIWRTLKPNDAENGQASVGNTLVNASEETSTESFTTTLRTTPEDTTTSSDKESEQASSRPHKVFHSVEVVRASYGDPLDIKCSLPGVDAQAMTWKFVASDVTDAINHFDVTSLGKIGDNRSVFSITKLSLMHTGTFTCSANDTGGHHVHDTRLVVLSSAPTFARPRQKSMTIERGQSVTIPCEAEGAPKPEVSWSWPRTVAISKRYTNADSSGHGKVYTSPDHVLHIENAVPAFGVMFLCTATNAVGRAMHEVYVTISPAHRPPQITTDLPESYNIESGQELTLDCSATGYPLPSISWKLPNNQRLHANETNSGYVMMANGALKLPIVTPEMAGRYQCIAENTEGLLHKSLELSVYSETSEVESETTDPSSRQTVDKSTTTFQVTRASSITNGLSRGVSRKTITRQTDVPVSLYSYKTASYYGDTVTLQCTRPSSNRRRGRQRWQPPKPVITWWELPSGEVASFPAQVPSWRHRPLYGGFLRIREVTSNDSGVYRCVGRHKFKGNVLSRTEVTLSVMVQPPVLRQAPRQRVVAYKGRMAKADCSVSSGKPKPRVYWVAPDGRKYTAGSYGNGLYVKWGGQLVIRSLDMSFLGTYQCIAANLAGNITRLVTFQTKPFVPKIRRNRYTRTVYVRFGRTARLDCTAVGVPTPDVYWILPGGQRVVESKVSINGDGGSGSGNYAVGGNDKFTLLASGTLLVSAAKSSDGGRYRCRAANYMGVATKTVRLQVYR